METMNITRRGILGIAAAEPAMLAATSAPAMELITSDPHWTALVADYHAKRSAGLASCSLVDDLIPRVHEAYAALPPKPQEPPTGLPGDLSDMTIAQIKAAASTPAHIAAWDEYEHDHAAWTAQREAIRQTVVGPATAHYDAAQAAHNAALDAVIAYRTSTLAHLAEKMEIVAAEFEGCDIPPEHFSAILADVRQMAAREAH